ncbi:MAG: CorA family divalent cation transporter, partial [Acidimicrobiia bacterium]
MQRLFHKKDGESPLVEHGLAEIEALRAGPGYIWLDLLGEPPEAIRGLAEMFGVDQSSLEESIDIALLPRMDEHDRYVFMVLEGLSVSTGERLATTEIDMFIGEKFLITIHRDRFPAVEWCQAPANMTSTTGLVSPARVAAFIAQLSTRRYFPLIEALDERIDVLEDMAIASDPRTLTEVHALRRDVGV